MNDASARPVAGSFRDPSGFVFTLDGEYYRQVNNVYADTWNAFLSSGLYKRLTQTRLLIEHTDADGVTAPAPDIAHAVIKPQRVGFVSYPYEWSFSQLKDAALATLEIQKIALEHEFSLKDCSAYNIQFVDGSPLFIDSLSFEPLREGEPWVAYRQFCQHFLAPLSLMAYRDVRLSSLLRTNIDGIPVDLASALLPFRTRFSFGLLSHIHLHARSQRKFSGTTVVKRRAVSKLALRGLVDNLEATIRRLTWEPHGTEWGDYYEATNYTDDAMKAKGEIVRRFVESAAPRTAWDLGANTGLFSRIAADSGARTVAFDIDPSAVEKNYRAVRQNEEKNLLPLVLDLTNPSPGLGWAHRERGSLLTRGPVDLVMGLALIHHLAISNNVPLNNAMEFFAQAGHWAIIEFVPKEDSQVKRLLATREDVFPDYHLEGFRKAASAHFDIVETKEVPGSERTLFLLRRRQAR